MRGARPLTAGLGIPTCGGVPTPLGTRVRAGCKPNSAEPSRKAPCLHRAKSMTGRLPVTGLAASLFRSCIGIRSGESCARLPIRSGALAGQGGRGCGGSRRPRRIGHPPHQTDIIGEIAKWPILPILQTMFGGRFTAPLHPRTRDHGRGCTARCGKAPGAGPGLPRPKGIVKCPNLSGHTAMSDLCLQSRLPHARLAYRLKSSSLSLFRWAEVAASFCEREFSNV